MIQKYHHASINYEIHGQGPVIVLLHGFLESVSMWRRLISEKIETNTLLVIDLPGHGKSDCLGEIHSMELMAEAVHFILAHHDVKSATIVGHSLGGYVALALIEKYHEKVNKLILLNSTPAKDSKDRIKNRDRALKVIAQNPRVFISMAIDNLFIDNSQDSFVADIQNMKNEALQFPIEGVIATILGMKARKDRTQVLKIFNKEKIMICGIDDPIINYNEAKILALRTLSQFKKIDGGHMCMIENYNETIKFIT